MGSVSCFRFLIFFNSKLLLAVRTVVHGYQNIWKFRIHLSVSLFTGAAPAKCFWGEGIVWTKFREMIPHSTVDLFQSFLKKSCAILYPPYMSNVLWFDSFLYLSIFVYEFTSWWVLSDIVKTLGNPWFAPVLGLTLTAVIEMALASIERIKTNFWRMLSYASCLCSLCKILFPSQLCPLEALLALECQKCADFEKWNNLCPHKDQFFWSVSISLFLGSKLLRLCFVVITKQRIWIWMLFLF